MKRKHCDKSNEDNGKKTSKKPKRRSSETSACEDEKHKKHKKQKKKHRRKSFGSTSDSSSDDIKRKEKYHKDKKKRDKKRNKHKENRSEETQDCFDVPISLMTASKEKAPMTKEEWEKRQNVVKRVFDESSGRYRLIKGDGEVIEEIISKERHKEINQQATRGDGAYFQTQLSTTLKTK